MTDQPERDRQDESASTHVDGDFIAGDMRVSGDVIYGSKIVGGEQPPTGPAIPHSQAGERYIQRPIADGLRESLRRGEQVGIRGVRGMGGVGKTELAIWLARTVLESGDFPGGVVWVTLSGRAVGVVLSEMEAQAGLPPAGEATPEERAARLRAALAGRPALVVLDDVRDEDCLEEHGDRLRQYYRPPAECALLVTTRRRSVPCLPKGTLEDLDVFEPDEAVRLLRETIGDEEACACEEDALEEVARLCGYHALALDVSGRLIEENLEVADKPIADQAERLRDVRARLDALADDEAELSVEASLSVSYESLGEEEQRRFDLLGVFQSEQMHPGPVAAVWGLEDDDAALGTLKRFRARSMAAPEGGLWRVHDLWRSFAARRLDERCKPGDPEREDVARAHAVAFAALAGAWSDVNDAHKLAPFLPDLAAAFEHAQAGGDPDLLYRLAWDTHNQ
jgi:hypothetical protein